MPVYLKVADKVIPMGEMLDNANDARHNGYPSNVFEVWEEKGKIFIQVKKPETKSKFLRTPGHDGCMY